MTYEEVAILLGGEGSDVGSGTLIHEYTTVDNDILRIYYKLYNNNFEVTNIIVEAVN